ncbi:MAG: UDP-N-acetylmuramoylalanyl-D-glutamate--2,6-diaminopimelate ligase [Adlercreutzia sp.]|uniref:UDP-N-acetylmuramoylalanyl-D-glutamate--2, 6-diaminopimelate ligase n=1 Tax=uncultured Adlercreutzia sp. TaxID=875803 RepID=UPI00216D0F91|nr:UDP-N-acetylmuramoylalanyl-D-glutamate--2,6-diaminopimelate ligase [uncultured Adlercreutzia sp.]MCI8424860.1 UDP-N-acetylmuramoylalanyl-D-glutamate--2,6-diaminopimelate ligase [Adlercreutzia sp.]
MRPTLTCPACHGAELDVRTFDSMMVLRRDLALFTLTCPQCAARISSLQPIPPSLREEVQFAAIELGAGMGASEEPS